MMYRLGSSSPAGPGVVSSLPPRASANDFVWIVAPDNVRIDEQSDHTKRAGANRGVQHPPRLDETGRPDQHAHDDKHPATNAMRGAPGAFTAQGPGRANAHEPVRLDLVEQR